MIYLLIALGLAAVVFWITAIRFIIAGKEFHRVEKDSKDEK